MDIDTMAGIDLQVNKAKRRVEDMVTNLTKIPQEFYRFAYELRK